MISITDPAIVNAYAAGLFDGEGSVLLMAGPKAAPYRIRLSVELTQVETAAVYWLQMHFGGTTGIRQQTISPRCRHATRWYLCGSSAVQFLQRIRPYLLLKGPQADVALEYISTLQKKGGIRIPVPAEVIAHRLELRARLRELNRRGVAS